MASKSTPSKAAPSPSEDLQEAAQEAAPQEATNLTTAKAQAQVAAGAKATAEAMVRVRALDHSGPWQVSTYRGEAHNNLQIQGSFTPKGIKVYNLVNTDSGAILMGPTNTKKALVSTLEEMASEAQELPSGE